MIDSLSSIQELTTVLDDLDIRHLGFEGVIRVEGVFLTYDSKNLPAVKNARFTINEGELVAIVGPSGACKTTIVDVLLGVLKPDKGVVSISGHPPLEAISKWPGSVAYVPQDVLIMEGNIRENVSMVYPAISETDNLVWEALRIAKLDQFVAELPEGLINYMIL